MDLYQKALARALDRPEADAGIAGEPMMAAVAHSQRVAKLEAEIERLTAALNAKPTPEAILLQARKPDGGEWTDIFPAQLSWMAKEGYDVRALDADEQSTPR